MPSRRRDSLSAALRWESDVRDPVACVPNSHCLTASVREGRPVSLTHLECLFEPELQVGAWKRRKRRELALVFSKASPLRTGQDGDRCGLGPNEEDVEVSLLGTIGETRR